MVDWHRFTPSDFEYDFDRDKATPCECSPAARAAFLARMHREKSLKSWLLRVIRERIELEEGAFVEAKREFALKPHS